MRKLLSRWIWCLIYLAIRSFDPLRLPIALTLHCGSSPYRTSSSPLFTVARRHTSSSSLHCCKAIIKNKYGQDAVNVGDEGSFAPNIQENEEGLELLRSAIGKAEYTGKSSTMNTSEFFVISLLPIQRGLPRQ